MDKEKVFEIFRKFLNDTKDMTPEEIDGMLMVYAMGEIVLREKHLIDEDKIIDCYFDAIELFEEFAKGESDGRENNI